MTAPERRARARVKLLTFRAATFYRVLPLHIGILGPVTQVMIHQGQRNHRFGDWRSPHTYAGVVPAGGNNFSRRAVDVNTISGQANAGCGLQGDAANNVLS